MIYHKSVKTKFKTIFARSVLAILMCIFCFTCTVGCSIFDGLKPSPNYGNNNEVGESDPPPTHPDHGPAPDDGDDDEDQDPDNMTEDEKDEATDGISVDYVKVLRRPISYDYENNVPDVDETGSKRYYLSFAEDILKWLFRTYGNFNTGYEDVLDEETGLPLATNNFDLYYQTTQNEKMAELSGSFQGNQDAFLYWYDAIRYRITSVEDWYSQDANGNQVLKGYTVTSDASKGWNWGLSYKAPSYESLLYAYKSYVGDDEEITSVSEAGNKLSNGFNVGDYNFNLFNKYYSGELIGEMEIDSELNTTAFSTAFNNEDYQVTLEYAIYSLVLGIQPHNVTVSYGTDGKPSVSVEGYSAKDGKTSAQVALEEIKSTFNRLGSYVGLTDKNKTAIVNYILDNVIGEEVVDNDSYTVSGINATVDYHYEDVVTAIVDYCGKLTTIGVASEGEAGGDSTNISDAYIASEIVDYPFLSFFSNNGYNDAFIGQKPYEYQSAVIIPRRETTITDLWLDFKYDAGNDGDEIYDPTKYLDITVSVRWNKGDGSPIKTISQKIRVKDGPADVGDTSTLEFEFEPDRGQYAFGEPLVIGMFNTPDALKTTADMLLPGTTERGIVVTGLTDARRYYKVLESATYGGYGVLDESKFDCSYLEIAYSVEKLPGDTTTNYAFYTSINNIWEDDEEDTSWMH